MVDDLTVQRPLFRDDDRGAWVITGRDLAVEVMRDAATFTVDDPRFSTAQVIGPSMLSLDGEEHARHRDPFAEHYRRRLVDAQLRPWVVNEAYALVDALAPAGEAELRSALAAPLAVRVIAHSLGLVDVSVDEVLDWYRRIVAAVEGITRGDSDQPDGHRAFAALRTAVEATVASGNDSLLGRAWAEGLSADEVASNAAVLMFGAIETSEGATANVFHHLLSNPDRLAEVSANPELVASAVEESFRLEPAAAQVDRYATGDVELAGEAISAGDYVVVSLRDANRDAAVFHDPERFDLRRENLGSHVTFAHGPHHCLGVHLARIETIAAVQAVISHLPGIQLDPDRSSPPDGAVFRKPPAVTAVWSA